MGWVDLRDSGRWVRRLVGMGAQVVAGIADNMWNKALVALGKLLKVLGVSRVNLGGRRRLVVEWEVQCKVEAKKAAYIKLAEECVGEEEAEA
ncbi:hypothetical protein H5410_049043 [Solanum commersonii]|uniref:Uncharacterized protein n=1 Tax=Solanum commersonii TaxID=4109 RepID=A0A9J5XJZ5_SOLCO|nr:hypothetical protein H5410_049043 [Solanum commersonii]